LWERKKQQQQQKKDTQMQRQKFNNLSFVYFGTLRRFLPLSAFHVNANVKEDINTRLFSVHHRRGRPFGLKQGAFR